MGFWVFMTSMELLLPLIMVGLGNYFLKGGPRQVNSMFGYRTARSMKNEDTWKFAHRHCGRIWRRWGITLAFFSLAVMLSTLDKGVPAMGRTGAILSLMQCVMLVASIFPTEWALRRTFDEDGRRR